VEGKGGDEGGPKHYWGKRKRRVKRNRRRTAKTTSGILGRGPAPLKGGGKRAWECKAAR